MNTARVQTGMVEVKQKQIQKLLSDLRAIEMFLSGTRKRIGEGKLWEAHVLLEELSLAASEASNVASVLDECGSVAEDFHGYCDTHKELYQELWAGEFMCESCFVAAFHADEFNGVAQEDRSDL